MSKYTTVVFDLDGTLLDTLEDLTDSVNYALDKHGFATHKVENIRRFVGNGIRQLMELAVPGGLDNREFEETFQDFKEHYSANCNNKTKPYDNVLELLEELNHRGIKMAIVSNKVDSAVKELSQTYFSKYISVAIGEGPSVHRKPAPDAVLEALNQLGSTVEESVYIGDSEIDIETASNAGMTCISCLWGFRDEACLIENGATYIIDDPKNVLHLI